MDWISLLHYSKPFFSSLIAYRWGPDAFPCLSQVSRIYSESHFCLICHISLYFSQHLNANHTSPFLSEYAWGVSDSSQPLSPIWNASSVSLIVHHLRLSLYSGRKQILCESTQRGSHGSFPSSLFWPLFPEDLKCGNPRATKNKDMMRWRGTRRLFREMRVIRERNVLMVTEHWDGVTPYLV